MIYTEVSRIPEWFYEEPDAPGNLPEFSEEADNGGNANIYGILAGNVKRRFGGIFFEVSKSGNVARLVYLYVKEEKREQGIASALAAAAMKHFKETGVKRVYAIIQPLDEGMEKILFNAGFEQNGGFYNHFIYDVSYIKQRLLELNMASENDSRMLSDIDIYESLPESASRELAREMEGLYLPRFHDTAFTAVRHAAGRKMSAMCGRIKDGSLIVDALSIADDETYLLLVSYILREAAKSTLIDSVSLLVEDYAQQQLIIKMLGEGETEQPVLAFMADLQEE